MTQTCPEFALTLQLCKTGGRRQRQGCRRAYRGDVSGEGIEQRRIGRQRARTSRSVGRNVNDEFSESQVTQLRMKRRGGGLCTCKNCQGMQSQVGVRCSGNVTQNSSCHFSETASGPRICLFCFHQPGSPAEHAQITERLAHIPESVTLEQPPRRLLRKQAVK